MASTMIFEWSFRYSLQEINRTDEYIELFKQQHGEIEVALMSTCKKYIFQLECTNNNNWHYAGYMNLKQKKKLRTLVNEFKDQFPGIEFSRSSSAGRLALQKYSMKKESRKAGPWADKPIYLGRDLPNELYEWQQQLEEYCMSDTGDREIYWLYDKAGSQGKSKWKKHMIVNKGAIGLAYSSTSNLINLVSKTMSKIYIVDLTRAKPVDIGRNDLYAAIEATKDGCVVNTKYETACVCFDPPAVVVLANVKPKMSELSPDRWKLKSLINGTIYDGLMETAPQPSLQEHKFIPAEPEEEMNQAMLQYVQPIGSEERDLQWQQDIGSGISFDGFDTGDNLSLFGNGNRGESGSNVSG